MKQTAVEWLIQKLTNRQNGVFDGLPHLSVDEIYNQALEMEKQQIIHAHGIKMKGVNNHKCVTGEQYYNKTYED